MIAPRRYACLGRVSSCLAALALVGCAPHAAYHKLAAAPGNCVGDVLAKQCRDSYYQEFADHDLAFIEFSERGNAFDDRMVNEVIDRIRRKADDGGVVVLTFVHGWKHSADEADDNVQEFKGSLQRTVALLKERFGGGALAGRRLVGVYVGWRGASITVPGLEQLTFWDRKAVAEELGSGGVTRLLLELDRATGDSPGNVLVVIGHSFGGAIVVRALSELMTERVMVRNGTDGDARAFGDGVIVINPAIEATQALHLVEAAIDGDYHASQLPLFVSLSSDADRATHYAFPAGQTIGLLSWKQTVLSRSRSYDRRRPGQAILLSEKHLDATTVGNFAPYLTHRLRYHGTGDGAPFEFLNCDAVPTECEPMGWTSLSGQPAIGPLPAHYPLYFVKTDESVMDGHNDIFNDRVRSFIYVVIDDVIRRAFARDGAVPRARPGEAPSAPVLARPGEFAERLGATLDAIEALTSVQAPPR
ncbi:MAG: hypothetical protein H6945_15605 [Zoogloeaceae bacterium]|nr:hypothetical protein [Rhodocyclaceae bacterium]MCP5237163.1 hypothetical protein [Zoogloeaceae bacterium]